MPRLVTIRALLAFATLACAGFAGSCAPRASGPSVILIVLDTVRADHLSAYGYGRPTTPHLEAFGESATRFTRAKATSPWTLPSHASMFTGLYPSEHTAHTVWLDPERPDSTLIDNVRPLPDAAVTLAEVLRDAGYQTAGIVANPVFLTPRYNAHQGFDTWEVRLRRAHEVNEEALAWLDRRDEGRPFLLFLNYMDAHNPYNTDTPRPEVAELAETDSRALLDELHPKVMPGTGDGPADRLAVLMDQYDVALRNLDEGLGELFTALRERGLYDDVVLLVTSDHGEFLGEHRLLAHSKDVYEPVMGVPMWLKRPGQTAGDLEERPVSLAQVPALLATECAPLAERDWATPWPSALVLGENHFTRLKDLRAPWSHRFLRSRWVAWDDDRKYIHSSDGQFEAYDLQADPAERANLLPDRAGEFEELVWQFQEMVQARSRAGITLDGEATSELSDEEREKLESLGYF
jgi:arylsulfatase A-like enzyme